MLLVSNMYPCKSQPVYGVFVKRFEEQMAGQGLHFKKSVIRGRKKSTASKLLAYFVFFIRTFYLYLVGSDLVYVHYANHSLVPIAIGRLFKKRPLVINAHGDDLLPRTTLTARLSQLLQPTFSGADAVVVPSDHFKRIASRNIDASRIIVSPSGGINTKLFKPDTNRTIERHHPIRFVYVSRIDEGKGWEVLTAALEMLANRDWLKVDFYGHGEQVEQLKSDIQARALCDVATYRGALPQHQLVDVFTDADCLIFPSFNESLGLVGLEAMACACPVIASDIAGLMSYVSSGDNGLVFKSGDKVDLAEKLEAFASLAPEEVLKLRENALQTARAYDAERVAVRLREDLKRLVPNGLKYA